MQASKATQICCLHTYKHQHVMQSAETQQKGNTYKSCICASKGGDHSLLPVPVIACQFKGNRLQTSRQTLMGSCGRAKGCSTACPCCQAWNCCSSCSFCLRARGYCTSRSACVLASVELLPEGIAGSVKTGSVAEANSSNSRHMLCCSCTPRAQSDLVYSISRNCPLNNVMRTAELRMPAALCLQCADTVSSLQC